ncbi:IS3 family transposase [Streptosporangium jomthongense]|uniref:IS3 family transposase n=1 Tax=Streptosporangium jomthongense TaxID=1193683 RepID=A0ABV8F241_9ACTN
MSSWNPGVATGPVLTRRRHRRAFTPITAPTTPTTPSTSPAPTGRSTARLAVPASDTTAESFFAMIKTEWPDRFVLITRTTARQQVIRYIEGFYNRRRLHSALDYRTLSKYSLSTPHAHNPPVRKNPGTPVSFAEF